MTQTITTINGETVRFMTDSEKRVMREAVQAQGGSYFDYYAANGGTTYSSVTGRIGRTGTKTHRFSLSYITINGENLIVSCFSICGSRQLGSGERITAGGIVDCKKCGPGPAEVKADVFTIGTSAAGSIETYPSEAEARMTNERLAKSMKNIADTYNNFAAARGVDLKLTALDNAIEFRGADGSILFTKTVEQAPLFDSLAFAAEIEAEINEIANAPARPTARISDLLRAYAKSIVGPNYTIEESLRYMANAIDDPTGWIDSAAPELLGLDCHYTEIDWIDDKENAKNAGDAAIQRMTQKMVAEREQDPGFCGECLSHYGAHRPTCPTFHITDWTSAEQRRSALSHFSPDELIAAAIKAIRANSPATKWNDDETALIDLTVNEQIAAAGAGNVAARIADVAGRIAIAESIDFGPTMFCPVCKLTKPDNGHFDCDDCRAAELAEIERPAEVRRESFGNPGAAAADRAAGISKAIASGKTAAERRAAGNGYGDVVEHYDD